MYPVRAEYDDFRLFPTRPPNNFGKSFPCDDGHVIGAHLRPRKQLQFFKQHRLGLGHEPARVVVVGLNAFDNVQDRDRCSVLMADL
jgi:hypothetical protein